MQIILKNTVYIDIMEKGKFLAFLEELWEDPFLLDEE